MAFQDVVRDLRELDFSELSLDNIGSWPLAVKVMAWVLAFIVLIVFGYVYSISDLRDQLAQVETKELDLKKEFEGKAFKAANLEALRKQMTGDGGVVRCIGQPAAERHRSARTAGGRDK